MTRRPAHSGPRPAWVTAVALCLGLALLTGCGSGSGGAATSGAATSGGATGPSATTAATSGAATGSSTSGAPVSTQAGSGTEAGSPALKGLVALWPFTTFAQVQEWERSYASGGHQPWHLDVEQTALSFTRFYLGYGEINRVLTRTGSGGDARIGVGGSGTEGSDRPVAVLHLLRWGNEASAPWVVVGSDDTLLTVDQPRYGSTVSSPMTVGGRITGVDESLRVKVLSPVSDQPLADVGGIGAGGQRQPWSTQVRFSAPSGTVLTVAVSTGGHVASVERFAITGVRVR